MTYHIQNGRSYNCGTPTYCGKLVRISDTVSRHGQIWYVKTCPKCREELDRQEANGG